MLRGHSPIPVISIHALHEESDMYNLAPAVEFSNFNPRSP